MGNTTKGMNVTVKNNSSYTLKRSYQHSYQIENWPPECFDHILRPGTGYAGRIEYFDQCTTGDTAAEVYYVVVGHEECKLKFDLTYHHTTVTVEGNLITADTTGWNRVTNGSVEVCISDR
jgi:hypothetical protein